MSLFRVSLARTIHHQFSAVRYSSGLEEYGANCSRSDHNRRGHNSCSGNCVFAVRRRGGQPTTDAQIAGDTTPPMVSSVDPEPDAVGVFADASVTATFSKPMNPSTIG